MTYVGHRLPEGLTSTTGTMMHDQVLIDVLLQVWKEVPQENKQQVQMLKGILLLRKLSRV